MPAHPLWQSTLMPDKLRLPMAISITDLHTWAVLCRRLLKGRLMNRTIDVARSYNGRCGVIHGGAGIAFVPVCSTRQPAFDSVRKMIAAVSTSSLGRLAAWRPAETFACHSVKLGPCRLPSGGMKYHARGCIFASLNASQGNHDTTALS